MFSLNLFKRYPFFLVLAFLAGCGSVSRLPDISESQKEAFWVRNQIQLEALQSWIMSGRLGLRVPQRSGSMSIEWQQHDLNYKIYLDGPFGQSIAEIVGTDRLVSARVSDGQEIFGPTPEYLMLQLTGWDFPVSSLKYWIKGIPAPGEKAEVQLNNQGYAQQIRQYGWQVDYLRFSSDKGLQIPSRLRASNGDIQLTLVVSDWELQ